MRLTDLFDDYKPVYPVSRLWSDTFQLLENDPAEKEVVYTLLEELLRDGDFREPIILSTPEEDDDGEEPYEPYVKNGTHRVYAYYLAGYQTIKAQHGWQDDNAEDMYGEDWSRHPNTVTVIKTTSLTPQQTIFSDEDFAIIADSLRSFRLTNDVWLTADLICVQNGNYSLYWSGIEFDEDNLKFITKTVLERLNRLFPNTYLVETRTFFNETDEMDFLDAWEK